MTQNRLTVKTRGLVFGLVLWLGALSPAFAQELSGERFEANCRILMIDGPLVETSCKDFVLGEEVAIYDLTMRTIGLRDIPLPSDAVLTYTCRSEKKCDEIVGIQVLFEIREQPY